VSRPPVRFVAYVACATAVGWALRAWVLPAWRRYAEHQARDAELLAG
jgi:hypothetical protein